MSDVKTVDARGLSCPEPVLMTQDALKEAGNASIAVEVTAPTARDNVKNLLEQQGRTVAVEDTADGWRIVAAAL